MIKRACILVNTLYITINLKSIKDIYFFTKKKKKKKKKKNNNNNFTRRIVYKKVSKRFKNIAIMLHISIRKISTIKENSFKGESDFKFPNKI